MKQIIKDGLIVENSWQHWTESGTTVSDIIGGRRQVIVPLQFLEEHAHQWADPTLCMGALLRTRHGFAGELRAVGDILRDQLYFLNRCGFNAFELREDQDLEAALAAFTDYAWQPNSRLYQEATP